MNSSDPLAVRLTWRWTLLYTRGLPRDVQQRRRLELESDLWEHRQDPDEPDAARELFGRFLRGIPADVRWRYRTLLDLRGARQRSQDMTTSIRTNWWVILTALLGIAAIVNSIGAAVFAGGDGPVGFRVFGVIQAVIGGGLVLSGLVVRKSQIVTGSWLILVGLLISGDPILIPLIALAVIGGFWTANLQLSERGDEPDLHPVRRHQVEMTTHWYLWLMGAAVLIAIGFVAVAVLDGQTSTGEDDESVIGGLAWLVWVLAWVGAILAGGTGIILGVLRGVVRHRTRLA